MTGMFAQMQKIAAKARKTHHENGHQGTIQNRRMRRAQKRGGFRLASVSETLYHRDNATTES